MQKLSSKDSHGIARAIKQHLSKCPFKIHTLTFDNDQDFSHHLTVAKALGATTYFTRPYTRQDKGTVETESVCFGDFCPKKHTFEALPINKSNKYRPFSMKDLYVNSIIKHLIKYYNKKLH